MIEIETGKVTVGDNLAEIVLPEGWGYLQQASAKRVVEQYWGNPPGGTLGMVLPPEWEVAEDSPTWGIIVDFEADGYVEDDDAADIDFDDLLSTMKADAVESNKARKKQGYQTVDLLGWAEPPHYDPASHTLYWAKDLKFEGEEESVLNYNMRVLGRRGVLNLNAVASIENLAMVKAGSDLILPATKFTSGNRYTDFVSGDKVAAYGIGGLIAGKLLLKGGFLKILAGLWKPIAVGVVALGAFVMKIFGGKKNAQPSEA